MASWGMTNAERQRRFLAGHSALFTTAADLLLDLNGQETARALEHPGLWGWTASGDHVFQSDARPQRAMLSGRSPPALPAGDPPLPLLRVRLSRSLAVLVRRAGGDASSVVLPVEVLVGDRRGRGRGQLLEFPLPILHDGGVGAAPPSFEREFEVDDPGSPGAGGAAVDGLEAVGSGDLLLDVVR